jgi:hypothetical protein
MPVGYVPASEMRGMDGSVFARIAIAWIAGTEYNLGTGRAGDASGHEGGTADPEQEFLYERHHSPP